MLSSFDRSLAEFEMRMMARQYTVGAHLTDHIPSYILLDFRARRAHTFLGD